MRILWLLLKSLLTGNSQELNGWYGEYLTRRKLLFVKLFGRDGKILHNVYIPKDNNETTELDVLYITQKGIFIFESKNYSGWIFGNDRKYMWTATLPNRQKYQFYNPIMQNKNHIKWLSKFLGDETPLFSIIVFSERCELKKIEISDSDVYVIKRNLVYSTVRDIWEDSPDVLSPDEVENIYNMLYPLTKCDNTVKQNHIENINKNYTIN